MQTASTLGEDYSTGGGTSLASPIVAASLAFAKQAYPNKSWSELAQIMRNTARPVAEFRDKSISGGSLDLYAMMEYLENEAQASIPLTANITANTESWTNQDIILTLRTNKNINTPSGWIKISNTEFRKTVSQNGTISVIAQNNFRQSQTVNYNITKIDKNRPTITIISPNKNTSTFNTSYEITFHGEDNNNES